MTATPESASGAAGGPANEAVNPPAHEAASRPAGEPAGAGTAVGGRAARFADRWHLVLVRAIVAILFGLVALLLPGPTIASLVMLFSAYMLVDGIFALLSGV